MIMEDQHMTQQVFADFIHQAPATLSSIFNGRTRPTLNIVEAIKSKFPDISTEWLLFGTGDMHITHPEASADAAQEQRPGVQEPMINFDSPVPVASPVVQSAPSSTAFQYGVKTTRSDYARDEVRIIDKEPRRVTEIRVYYDDQTYETFVPAKK